MSNFVCEVYDVAVESHPDPETTGLELARIGDYLSVVRKGQYTNGDKVVYIPEASLLPDALVAEMGLQGRLAGSGGNRVKAVKLRGILSQGLVYPAKPEWVVGQDVQVEMGITKWEPVVPVHFSGEVGNGNRLGPVNLKFDLENIKKYKDLFIPGEEVYFTEKIHGTCQIFGLVPKKWREAEMLDGRYFVSSKGLSASGLFMKDNQANSGNLYLNIAKQFGLGEKLLQKYGDDHEEIIWIVGESFGKGVQDLAYTDDKTYRAFGIKIGNFWLDFPEFLYVCKELDIPTVPVLYNGLYSKELMLAFTSGKEMVSGNEKHIREGIVIYPAQERYDRGIGRVVLKSVSAEYLTRKNKDATEFQ